MPKTMRTRRAGSAASRINAISVTKALHHHAIKERLRAASGTSLPIISALSHDSYHVVT
jgi:hypothetical protein